MVASRSMRGLGYDIGMATSACLAVNDAMMYCFWHTPLTLQMSIKSPGNSNGPTSLLDGCKARSKLPSLMPSSLHVGSKSRAPFTRTCKQVCQRWMCVMLQGVRHSVQSWWLWWSKWDLYKNKQSGCTSSCQSQGLGKDAQSLCSGC